MIGLGIDAGLSAYGAAVVDFSNSTVLAHGCLLLEEYKTDMAKREVISAWLKSNFLNDLKLPLSFAGIEKAWVGRSKQIAVRLSETVGFTQGIIYSDCRIMAYLIPPSLAKKAMTGNGKAEKTKVQICAQIAYQVSGTLTEHEYDAMSVAQGAYNSYIEEQRLAL